MKSIIFIFMINFLNSDNVRFHIARGLIKCFTFLHVGLFERGAGSNSRIYGTALPKQGCMTNSCSGVT